MASSMGASVENDVDQPNISRIRDYWLDGAHHTEIDRDFGDRIAVCAPHLPYLVRIQRALTRRLVHYAIENGVRQFLDLGSGVPAGGNVHEVAQEIDPTCRVVYVDLDPGITQEGRSLLAGNVRSAYLQADIRKPAQILEAAAFMQRGFSQNNAYPAALPATFQASPASGSAKYNIGVLRSDTTFTIAARLVGRQFFVVQVNRPG